MKIHQAQGAKFLIAAFSLVVLSISASTSFGFFYRFFSALIPPSLLGAAIGALISGLIGVLLFDVACSIWLYTFLHHAITPEQRAVSLIMCGVTFIGAAAASIAHLALTASSDMALDASAVNTIAMISLVAVIVGVIANFGASLAYQRFDYGNKQKVREADRHDEIQRAEDEHAAYLDSLISQRVKERLAEAAPQLADIQARRIASRFNRDEAAKYANTGETAASPRRPSPTPPPQTASNGQNRQRVVHTRETVNEQQYIVCEHDPASNGGKVRGHGNLDDMRRTLALFLKNDPNAHYWIVNADTHEYIEGNLPGSWTPDPLVNGQGD